MELQASRAAARTDAEGQLVLLADQDRARWDPRRIARGLAGLERAGPIEQAGPYQLQAAVAACHARAGSWEATDWPGIVVLYDALMTAAPSPVVALNRAVAIGLAHGPAAGLAALDQIDAAPLQRLPPASRPPARISCAGSAAGRKRQPSIAGPSSSPTTGPSGRSWPRGSPRVRTTQPERTRSSLLCCSRCRRSSTPPAARAGSRVSVNDGQPSP